MTHKDGHNKQLDIIVETGVQELYDRIIAEFPKVRNMIEEEELKMRTARKRYYETQKQKKRLCSIMTSLGELEK